MKWISKGEMIDMGTYDELSVSSLPTFHSILHQTRREHEEEEEEEQIDCRCRTHSEKECETTPLLDDLEVKYEGSIDWRVYLRYFQAGLGMISGIIVILIVFSLREISSVYYSWWLARWNDDENYRYRYEINCTTIENEQKIQLIRSMNDTEWNEYRQRRFYNYSGRYQ